MKKIFFKFLFIIVFIVGCDSETTNSPIDPLIGNWNQTHSGETTCEEGGCSAMTYSTPNDNPSCGPYSTFAQNNTFTYNECCLNDQTNAIDCETLFYGTWETLESEYILTATTIDEEGHTLAEIVTLVIDSDGAMNTLHDHCTIDHPLVLNNCLGAKFIKGAVNITACTQSCTDI